jgi:sodium/proline symporter
VIAAAIAAVMSTVDSQILVAVSAVVGDIYGKLLGGDIRSSRGVWLGRLTGILLGGAAFLLALQRRGVFEQVFDAWGGLAAGLGPAVCFSLLWPRSTFQGILAGMLVGSLLAQVWPLLERLFPHPVVTVWPGGLIPSFGLSCLTIWAVSLATRRR